MDTNCYITLIITCAILLLIVFIMRFLIIKEMIAVDEKHEKTENGKKLVGRTRNCWDYSFFPVLEKVGLMTNPKLVLASMLLIFLTICWALL